MRDQNKKLRNKVKLEASGGINSKNIAAYAKTGVDMIAVGEITNSTKGIDLSLIELTRKIVTLIEKNESKSISVTKNNLPDLLGVPIYQRLEIEKEDLVGITTGLAWTEVGGELLTIEAAIVDGKGKITRTGKLGDVMQESIEAAMTVVRSRSELLGIEH